jgi:hypothetical protein
MAGEPYVQALGEHNYLLRVVEGEDAIEIRIYASPTIVGLLPPGTDETHVVEATAAYLMHRQLAVDLPASLDLDDVAAAYDDYLTDLGSRLHLRDSQDM